MPRGPRLVDFALLRAIDGGPGSIACGSDEPSFDAHEELFQAMAEYRAVTSSSTPSSRVRPRAPAMRRGYTVERYLGQIARLRVVRTWPSRRTSSWVLARPRPISGDLR
jgi:hypothetical protein